MLLTDALGLIAPHLRDEVCVHANGYLSRAAFALRDDDRCFYMIGSMGLAASIGLGIAMAQPARRVVVFDGDGNVLHLCFDNAAHASTGGQPTISDRVALEQVARAAGYRWAGRVESPAELADEAPRFLAREGPAFLLVRVALGPPGPPGRRIPHPPEAMTARLRRALGS